MNGAHAPEITKKTSKYASSLAAVPVMPPPPKEVHFLFVYMWSCELRKQAVGYSLQTLYVLHGLNQLVPAGSIRTHNTPLVTRALECI